MPFLLLFAFVIFVLSMDTIDPMLLITMMLPAARARARRDAKSEYRHAMPCCFSLEHMPLMFYAMQKRLFTRLLI